MALGLPVIGADAGAIPEIVTPDVDGLLFSADDEVELAEAIARLMDDSELRDRLGQTARQTVMERFDSRIGAAVLYEGLSALRLRGSRRRSLIPSRLGGPSDRDVGLRQAEKTLAPDLTVREQFCIPGRHEAQLVDQQRQSSDGGPTSIRRP